MKLSDSEWKLMNALWQEFPATAREISERLDPEVNWAYTTVKTLLSRLAAKGAISEYKRSNLSFYEPILTKRKARVAALRSVLDNAFEGAFGPLVHFLVDEKALPPAEQKKLLTMLNKKPKGGSKK